MRSIDRETLRTLLGTRSDVVLVEALSERHYASGHLPGARNLPHDAVERLAPSVLPDRAAEIVVYCANAACRNSVIAAEALVRMGYTRVAVYEGGKKDWTDAGLPLEEAAGAALS